MHDQLFARDASVRRCTEHAARLEARLRRSGHAIELRDLLIAATALEHGLSLVTRNVTHFRGTGLTVSNPFS